MKLFTTWRRKRLARRLVADYGRGYIEAPRLSQPPPSATPQPGIPTMNLLDGPMRAPERDHPVDVLVWTGNTHEVAEFLDAPMEKDGTLYGRQGPAFTVRNDGQPAILWVTKSQAWCDVNLGDGIAQEADGSGFYPVAADRLAEDFDPVADDELPPARLVGRLVPGPNGAYVTERDGAAYLTVRSESVEGFTFPGPVEVIQHRPVPAPVEPDPNARFGISYEVGDLGVNSNA